MVKCSVMFSVILSIFDHHCWVRWAQPDREPGGPGWTLTTWYLWLQFWSSDLRPRAHGSSQKLGASSDLYQHFDWLLVVPVKKEGNKLKGHVPISPLGRIILSADSFLFFMAVKWGENWEQQQPPKQHLPLGKHMRDTPLTISDISFHLAGINTIFTLTSRRQRQERMMTCQFSSDQSFSGKQCVSLGSTWTQWNVHHDSSVYLCLMGSPWLRAETG